MLRFQVLLLLAVLSLFAPLNQGAGPNNAAPAVTRDNYLKSPHLVALRRWKRLPVRVYFSTGGAYTPERQRLAQAGFDQWEKASGGVLNYRVVSSPRDADVTVRFSPGAAIPPGTKTLGVTLVSSYREHIRRAQMELATAVSRPEDLSEVAAHEWGHALGINGHSDDADDLMYGVTTRYIGLGSFFTPPPRTVSSRDLNTIKAAYPSLFRPKK